MSNDDEQKLRDVPHVEIRKTDVRQIADVDVRADGISAAVKLLREIVGGCEQEKFVILILDVRGRVTAWREVARGREDSVVIPVRALFRTALMLDASAIILSHNHPSQDPTPSNADIAMTSQLRLAGEMINVSIVDHIIIGGGERYYSMAKGDFMSTATMNVSGDREPPEF